MERERQPDQSEVRAIHALGFEEVGRVFEGVDARLVPLDAGDVEVGVHGVAAGGCAAQRQPARSALFAEGTVQPGTVALLLVTRNEGGARYNGEALPRGSAVLYGPGAVHTGGGRGEREFRALTFPADVYRSSLSALLQADPQEIDGKRLPLELDPRAQRAMEDLLGAPERALKLDGGAVQAGLALQEETLPGVCALLAKALVPPGSSPASGRKRRSLFHDARDFVHAHYHQPLQMADLCRALGASAESLRLAFQQYVNMPPMRYLKTLRLVKCHEKLLGCDPSVENVKTVARGCGIRELGRFAAAYQRLYGRLPSEELRRRQANKPGM